MTEFLKKIIEEKKREVEEKKKNLPFSKLFKKVKNIASSSLFSSAFGSHPGIIAEIKKASPSRGNLFRRRKIENLAKAYQEHGASAISVVTEEKYFLGSLNDLKKLKAFLTIPVLRKDFILDEYQILESKLFGADAVLFIAGLFTAKKIKKLLQLAEELAMEALIEIHTREELFKVLEIEAKIIGINNRDLNTFQVDLNTSKELLPLIPNSKIKIVESGIKDKKDINYFKKLKVSGFLIGEAFITSPDPGATLRLFTSYLKKNDKN
ncbi:MAG: indole-3-glycerol phosphate synthase TrpC [Candidatus Aminicenantales bacterium]